MKKEKYSTAERSRTVSDQVTEQKLRVDTPNVSQQELNIVSDGALLHQLHRCDDGYEQGAQTPLKKDCVIHDESHTDAPQVTPDNTISDNIAQLLSRVNTLTSMLAREGGSRARPIRSLGHYSSHDSLMPGHCYLRLFPASFRGDALTMLGQYPTVGNVLVYAESKFNVSAFIVPASVELNDMSILHVEYDGMSANTLIELIGSHNYGTPIGAHFVYGNVQVRATSPRGPPTWTVMLSLTLWFAQCLLKKVNIDYVHHGVLGKLLKLIQSWPVSAMLCAASGVSVAWSIRAANSLVAHILYRGPDGTRLGRLRVTAERDAAFWSRIKIRTLAWHNKPTNAITSVDVMAVMNVPPASAGGQLAPVNSGVRYNNIGDDAENFKIDILAPLVLCYDKRHRLRPVSPQDYTVSYPSITDETKRTLITSRTMPSSAEWTRNSSPDELYDIQMSMCRALFVTSMTSHWSILVVSDDFNLYPQEGYYHILDSHISKYGYRLLSGMNSATAPKGDERTIAEGSFIDAFGEHNCLFFPMNQYCWDLKTIASKAVKLNASEFWTVEIMSHDILVEPIGPLPTLGMSWRTYMSDGIEYTSLYSTSGGQLVITVPRVMIAQYMLAGSVNMDDQCYVKYVMHKKGDLQLCRYALRDGSSAPTLTTLTNPSSARFVDVVLMRESTQSSSMPRGYAASVPHSVVDRFIAILARTRNPDIHTTISTTTTMGQIYNRLAKEPAEASYIVETDILNMLVYTLNTYNTLRETAGESANEASLIANGNITAWEMIKLCFSREYRLQTYAMNLMQLLIRRRVWETTLPTAAHNLNAQAVELPPCSDIDGYCGFPSFTTADVQSVSRLRECVAVCRQKILSIMESFERSDVLPTTQDELQEPLIPADRELQNELQNTNDPLNLLEEFRDDYTSASGSEQRVLNTLGQPGTIKRIMHGNLTLDDTENEGHDDISHSDRNNMSDSQSDVTNNALHNLIKNNPKKLGNAHPSEGTVIRHDFVGYLFQECDSSRTYPTNNGHLLEAVYVNPEYASKALANDNPNCGLAESLDRHMTSARIIVIRGKVVSNLPKSAEMLDNNAVVAWDNGGFRRVHPQDRDAYFLQLKGKLAVQTKCLATLQMLADHNVVDCVAQGCYHRATGDDKTSVALAPEIRRGLNSNVMILYDNHWYGVETDPAHVLYVEGTHCMKLDVSAAIDIIKLYTNKPVTEWSISLNGPIKENSRLRELLDAEAKVRSASSDSRRFESVREVMLYNITLERTLLQRFSLIDPDKDSSYLRATSEMCVYDTTSGKFINTKPGQNHSYCYCAGEFQELKYNKASHKYYCDVVGQYIFMSDDISFLRERQMIDKMMPQWKAITEYNFDAIIVELWQGVAGCGKSTKIWQLHTAGVTPVLTATRAARQDLLDKSGGKHKEYYRTYDSVLMNGGPAADTAFGDEALMEHAGEVLLTAYIMRLRELIIFGDSQQIPFINRALGFAMNNHIMDIDLTKYMNITYRNPKCMEHILKQFYPNVVIFRDNPLGTCRVKVVKSIDEIPKDLPTVFVFTQDEKKTASKYFNTTDVASIHEVQGQNRDDVAIVRLVRQSNQIYDSPAHILVGITRHKVNLIYYTVVEDDDMCKVLSLRWETKDETIQSLERSFEPININPVIEPIMERRNVHKTYRVDKEHEELMDIIFEQTAHISKDDVEFAWETFSSPLDEYTEGAINTDPAVVQEMYDGIFESIDNMEMDRLASQDPYPLEPDVKVDAVRLALSDGGKQQRYMNPIINTTQYKRDPGTLTSMMNTVRKRNMDPPIIHYARPPSIVNDIVDKFIETYIDEDKLVEAIDQCNFSSMSHTASWLNSRDGTRKKTLNSMKYTMPKEHVYATHNRPDIKAKLDGAHGKSAPAAQSVTAHPPMVTAKYAGMSQYITDVCKVALKPRWVINDGLRADQIDGAINHMLLGVDATIAQEVDFGKFDKSQEEICLDIVNEIMRRFGVPEDVITQWSDAHKLNLLIYPKLGIALNVKFQRRSGDVLTFIGNTLLTMAVLAYTHDYTKAFGGLFGGDDSLVFLPPDTEQIDQSGHIAEVFNLSAKLENFRLAPKFASKFLIFAEGHYRLVADPVKVITRLGRHDYYCEEHVELAWESFKDSYKAYLNPSVRQAVCEAAGYRYNHITSNILADLSYLGDFISELVTNKTMFCNLFHGDADVRARPLLPSIKAFMGRKQSRQMGIVTQLQDELDVYADYEIWR